jgi:hypothetical protein
LGQRWRSQINDQNRQNFTQGCQNFDASSLASFHFLSNLWVHTADNKGAEVQMKKTLIILASLVIGIFSSAASAEMTLEQRQSDAQSLIDLFEHRYAPTPWKKSYLRINTATLAEEFLANVSEEISDEDFYAEVAKYLAGLKDAHVKPLIPSSYRATLGFEVDDVGGKVLITYVYNQILSEEEFPFKKGDRLVSIDGIPVDQLREELALFYTTGTAHSDARVNASNLTWRDQSSFPIVPEGTAEVTIEPQGLDVPVTLTLPWVSMGMPLAPTNIQETTLSKGMSRWKKPQGPLDRLRNIPAAISRNRHNLTTEATFLNAPEFPLWETFEKIQGAPLLAGTATVGGKKVAFMRIGTFLASIDKIASVTQLLSEQIPTWEESTEAMILDLTSNDGGFVCYGENIASFLIDKPIDAPKFQIKPTRTWSVEFEMELEWTSDDNDRAIIEEMVNQIRESLVWDKDLTEPMPICRLDGKVIPADSLGLSKTTYTKPIIILVNELNASAGEIFPAMLQDAGRAIVFGARTMGAGGSVGAVGPMGNSDISVSITESLVWRTRKVITPEGVRTHYIENIGVIPDVEYDVTMKDFLGYYEEYLNALEATLVMQAH